MPIVVDKEKKKREIIDAAIGVFSRQSYRRTKIKDIADEAKVGKGTVYEYFRSKEDLFFQMSEHLFEQYLLRQIESLESVTDPVKQIRTMITTTLENAAMWTGLVYLYIDVWSEMDRKDEEDKLRQLMSEMVARWINILSGYIREGQARGVFKELDARYMAHIGMAVLDGLMLQLLISRNMFDHKEMADTLADVLLEGLKK